MDEAHASEPFDVGALALALGGFEPRDEDVRLEPAPAIGRPHGRPRTVGLAGVDGDGRAVLVARVDPDDAVLLAVDALAWCDACGDLLARRLGADERIAPGVVLILDREDERALAGLAALRPDALRVFVQRVVHSARGSTCALREIVAARTLATSPDELDLLDEASRAWVDRLIHGMSCIDPGITPARAPQTILWRHGDAVLASLRVRGGRLEAEAAGERIPLGSTPDLERVLESALRGYLGVAKDDRLHPVAGSAPSATAQVESTPPRAGLMPVGPLLSADELAVLRGEG